MRGYTYLFQTGPSTNVPLSVQMFRREDKHFSPVNPALASLEEKAEGERNRRKKFEISNNKMTRKEVREENEKEVVDAQNKNMEVLKTAYSSDRQKETSSPPNTDTDTEVVLTKGKEKKNLKRHLTFHVHLLPYFYALPALQEHTMMASETVSD